MKKMMFIFKFLPVLCIVIGIGLLIEGVNKNITINNKTGDYESCTGYYIDKEVYSEARSGVKHRRPTTYTLIYAYNVNGVDYTVKTDHGTGAIPDIGSAKEIKYNPENPAEAIVGGTNSSTVLMFMGIFFISIPLVMILGWLVINGKLGRLAFNFMDIITGTVTLFIGGGFIYIIAGGFSLRELWMLAGPFGLIPMLLVIAGVYLIGRGIFGKQPEMNLKG